MKRILIFTGAMLFALSTFAQLNQVVVEQFTLTNPLSVQPAGTTTYRVYAQMDGAVDKVTAVFATLNCHSLDVSTTTTFHNDALGTTTGAAINTAFFAFFPTYEADSWVTIGADNSAVAGAADIGALATVPLNPYSGSVGTTPGTNLVMSDGIWYTLPTSPTCLPTGPNNRVLLGQFTTDGIFSFNINIQVFVGGNQPAGRADYVWSVPCVETFGDPTGFEVDGSALGLSYVFGGAATGCTDDTACNYDPIAEVDNGTCEYPEAGYDCNGDCLVDTDGDGVCDPNEIPGCTDVTACNYDMAATDDDASCTYPEQYFDCEGNCLMDTDGDGVCDELEIPGCTDVTACNYDMTATDDDASCVFAEQYYDCEGNCLMDTDGDGVCDELEILGCTNPTACNYNMDATDEDFSCVFAEQYFDCEGNCLMDTDGDGVCDELEIEGCLDDTACNYNPDTTDEVDCVYAEQYYDCDGNCLMDTDGDGVCDELEIAGCTDAAACNYNADATDDNGSCEYVLAGTVVGSGASSEGTTETYTYDNTAGSTYAWTVVGGTIVSGQGTASISVMWDTAGTGSVSVVETNADGCVGDEVSIDVDVAVSVGELEAYPVAIYPVPANDQVIISAKGWNGLTMVRVSDMTGRVVSEYQMNGTQLNMPVSQLASGQYIVTISGVNGATSARISVQH